MFEYFSLLWKPPFWCALWPTWTAWRDSWTSWRSKQIGNRYIFFLKNTKNLLNRRKNHSLMQVRSNIYLLTSVFFGKVSTITAAIVTVVAATAAKATTTFFPQFQDDTFFPSRVQLCVWPEKKLTNIFCARARHDPITTLFLFSPQPRWRSLLPVRAPGDMGDPPGQAARIGPRTRLLRRGRPAPTRGTYAVWPEGLERK